MLVTGSRASRSRLILTAMLFALGPVLSTAAVAQPRPERMKLKPDPDFDDAAPKKSTTTKTKKGGEKMPLADDPDFDEPKKPRKKPKPGGISVFQRGLLRGSISSKLSFDTKIDNQFEDVWAWENRFDLGLSYQFRPNIRAVIDARMSYWVTGEGNEQERFYLFNSQNTKWEFEVELREAYLDFRFGWFRLTVGNQTIRWGQTDSQSPLDVLNPVDMRDGVPTDFKTPLVPILAVNMQAAVKGWNFQLVWIPFFQPHKINLFGTDFAIGRQGTSTPFGPILSQISSFIDPSIEDKLQPSLQATKRPDENPKNSSVGVRIAKTFGPVDMAVMYHFGWDRYPVFHVDPDLVTLLSAVGQNGIQLTPDLIAAFTKLNGKDPSSLLSSEYKRQHVAGFELAWGIDPVTIKLDVAYIHRRTYYDDQMAALRKPALAYSVGIEWQHSDWITLSFEFTHVHAFGMDKDQKLYLFHREQMFAFGLFRISFLSNNALEFQVSSMLGINDLDFLVAGQVRYKITDSWSVALGAVFFEGKENSTLGMFDNNDYFYFQGTFAF
ncbi:MAG: hypothetical protein KC609_19735 [Myxococcales bacterium]|nr:hypothetical protein [Myxococcales bacterium]